MLNEIDNRLKNFFEKFDSIEEEEDCEEIEEANDTGSGGEYMTPFAFTHKKKTSGEMEREKTSIRQTAFQNPPKKTAINFKKVEDIEQKWLSQIDEVSYPEYKADESKTQRQKINTAIHEMNRMLGLMEKSIRQNMKLKTEMGMDQTSFWKSTSGKFASIDNRLNKISLMVKELSK